MNEASGVKITEDKSEAQPGLKCTGSREAGKQVRRSERYNRWPEKVQQKVAEGDSPRGERRNGMRRSRPDGSRSWYQERCD